MTDRRELTVVADGQVRAVEVVIATAPPWSLSLQLEDGVVHTAEAADLFAALDALRLQLESVGLLICCEGARPDVFPSGMARQMGGGRRAYRHTAGETPGRGNLVDIFDPVRCADVVTVQEQRDAMERIRGR